MDSSSERSLLRRRQQHGHWIPLLSRRRVSAPSSTRPRSGRTTLLSTIARFIDPPPPSARRCSRPTKSSAPVETRADVRRSPSYPERKRSSAPIRDLVKPVPAPGEEPLTCALLLAVPGLLSRRKASRPPPRLRERYTCVSGGRQIQSPDSKSHLAAMAAVISVTPLPMFRSGIAARYGRPAPVRSASGGTRRRHGARQVVPAAPTQGSGWRSWCGTHWTSP